MKKSKVVKELEELGGEALQRLKRGIATSEDIAKIDSLIKRLSVEIKRKGEK